MYGASSSSGSILQSAIGGLLNGGFVNLIQSVGSAGGVAFLSPYQESGVGSFFMTLFAGWLAMIITASIQLGKLIDPENV